MDVLDELPSIPNVDMGQWMDWKKISIIESNEPLVMLNNISDKIIVNPIYFKQKIKGSIQDVFVRFSVR